MRYSLDIGIAVRVMTALIFLSAACGKARHWTTFQGVVANYRVLPAALIRPVAYLLPPLEALIGVTLLTLWAPWAELAAAFLLALFGAAMGINLRRGRGHIDCGCFQNTLKQTLRWRLVVRNALLALLLVGGAMSAVAAAPAEPWPLVSGLLGGVALFVVWQSLNTLWSIVPAFGMPRAPLHTHSEGST